MTTPGFGLALTRGFSKDAAMATGDASAPSIADAPRPRAGRSLARACRAAWRTALETPAEAERDQLPLWLPVGLDPRHRRLVLACPTERAWIAFLLLAGALTLGRWRSRRATRWGRALAIFCLAALLGCGLIWWKAERVAAPRLERAQLAGFDRRGSRASSACPPSETVRLVVAPEAATALPPRLRVNVDGRGCVPALEPRRPDPGPRPG